ncbi:aspartate--tRNA ligase 2, cytoplasmic-like [Bidens hawaiensis]|uniref:aspartate--tRNA ligase 2, cytoplasmic-like n=1 Tax=Bidens hawaiensis TaxID=980011 RepID=UPI00404AEC2A
MAKKQAAKAEKLHRKQEAAAAAVANVSIDPLAANYGDLSIEEVIPSTVSGRLWTSVRSLTDKLNNQTVLMRVRVQAAHAVSKNVAFLTVREECCTVQCVLDAAPGVVSVQMVKYAANISKESVVDIQGVVTVPPEPIKGTSQQVEVQVRTIHTVDRAESPLPINVEDASRSEAEIERALEAREQLARVNQDTRLNHRVIDMRAAANQGIIHLVSEVAYLFQKFLRKEGFANIFTPKLNEGASEGGAAVFKLDYKGKAACLAQSPQLHK